MFDKPVNIHFTRQFLQQIKQQLLSSSRLMCYLEKGILPVLRRHPAIGRLLLNRETGSSELQRLNDQLCHQLSRGDLREYCFEQYVVVYLLHGSALYLLSCLAISAELITLWEREEILI